MFKLLYNCGHVTCQQGYGQNPLSQASAIGELRTSRYKLIQKKQRNQRSNCQHSLEKAREFQRNLYCCFIGYTKAFNCVDHNILWKILKEMGIPDHLTCLLRNLYVSQKVAVRTGHEATDWFKTEKGIYIKTIYHHSAYLTSVQSTSCEMLGWMKHKLESRLPGEISITSDMSN